MGQIRRSTRYLTIAATLAASAAAALLVVSESGRAQQSGGGWTFTLYERASAVKVRFVDAKPFSRRERTPRPSVGDAFAYRSALFSDAARTRRTGTLFGFCSVVAARSTLERSTSLCNGVLRLSNGSIAVRRLLPATTGAVLGGTGAYEGARGSVAVQADRSGPFGVVELLP